MLAVEEHGPITRVRMARTLGGRPLHEVSAYLVGGLLIDAGPPPAAGALTAFCRERGVERVVLTHHHEDHSGGAARLAADLGLPVAAAASAVPLLAAGLRIPFYRRLVWGRPRRFRAEPLGPVVEAAGLRLEVVPTPGHAATHVCLFEPRRRWLFSGDLYVHPRVRYLRRIEDLDAHLRSLRRVAALEPELLLCAHAGPVAGAGAALAAKIGWWEELGGRAAELAAAGLPAARITRRLLGREGLFTYLSGGDFSKRNLVRALLAGAAPEGGGRPR